MEYSRVERCMNDMDDHGVSVMEWWIDNVDSGEIQYEEGITIAGKRYAVLGSPTDDDIFDFKRYFGSVVKTRDVNEVHEPVGSKRSDADAGAGSDAGADVVLVVPWDLKAPWS